MVMTLVLTLIAEMTGVIILIVARTSVMVLNMITRMIVVMTTVMVMNVTMAYSNGDEYGEAMNVAMNTVMVMLVLKTKVDENGNYFDDCGGVFMMVVMCIVNVMNMITAIISV